MRREASALPDCYVRCGGGPERPVAVYTLHVMDRDGQHISQISPFEMFEWTPSVDDHGQSSTPAGTMSTGTTCPT